MNTQASLFKGERLTQVLVTLRLQTNMTKFKFLFLGCKFKGRETCTC